MIDRRHALAARRPATVAIAANGHELPSVAERPTLVPTTKLETVELGGRTHHVAITRPRAFDPHAAAIPCCSRSTAARTCRWSSTRATRYVMDQWYADAGFIVVRSDGRGTPGRGRAWERAIFGDLITVPLDDQVGALQALGARHPEIDLRARRRLRLVVRRLLLGDGAAAPPRRVRVRASPARRSPTGRSTTPRTPSATCGRRSTTRRATPRRARSPTPRKLDRPLLIIHGITDDNVHLANTLALIEDLYVAGKRAEVVMLSARTWCPDPKLALAREQVQIDFFREHREAT